MIPMADLRAQYRSIKPDVDRAVLSVLETGQFVLGPEVEAFEREFAAHCGASDCVALNSGTSALHLALLAAGVGPGDEVITVPFTFVATVSAIVYTGATPVFVDVEPVHLTMDPGSIEARITSRTKAIVPVHLYGQPADMTPIVEIARRRGLTVIEDAAQAHGAEYGGRRCGSLGDVAAFSFYPGKNLGACGEGGAAVTSDAGLARAMRRLRDWGQERKYEHLVKGFNYRMDGIQGAILRVKLRHLDAWTAARRSHAAAYDRLLADLAPRLPTVRQGSTHVYHVYTVRLADRERYQRELSARGIQTGIHYPIPVHLQPAHADLGHRPGDFPNAERAAAEVLSLPMFAELTAAQIDEVGSALREAASAVSKG